MLPWFRPSPSMYVMHVLMNCFNIIKIAPWRWLRYSHNAQRQHKSSTWYSPTSKSRYSIPSPASRRIISDYFATHLPLFHLKHRLALVGLWQLATKSLTLTVRCAETGSAVLQETPGWPVSLSYGFHAVVRHCVSLCRGTLTPHLTDPADPSFALPKRRILICTLLFVDNNFQSLNPNKFSDAHKV